MLIDATGSMDTPLVETKNCLNEAFKHVCEALTEASFSTQMFQMQIAVYRNYSSGVDGILESSSWTNDATVLGSFLSGVKASGGLLYEAIEIGLWHANREILQEYEDADGIPPSQIFIIGDAPPNKNVEAINIKKKYKGLQDWKPIEKSKQYFN